MHRGQMCNSEEELKTVLWPAQVKAVDQGSFDLTPLNSSLGKCPCMYVCINNIHGKVPWAQDAWGVLGTERKSVGPEQK